MYVGLVLGDESVLFKLFLKGFVFVVRLFFWFWIREAVRGELRRMVKGKNKSIIYCIKNYFKEREIYWIKLIKNKSLIFERNWVIY